jgi:sulfane dehydrogenase subunit SoxC
MFVTPNGLHFAINHGGVPIIDPEKHRLVIHGLVKQLLEFSLESLSRYPMTSRVSFLECGGNSAPMFSPQPMQDTRPCRRCTVWSPARSGPA